MGNTEVDCEVYVARTDWISQTNTREVWVTQTNTREVYITQTNTWEAYVTETKTREVYITPEQDGQLLKIFIESFLSPKKA